MTTTFSRIALLGATVALAAGCPGGVPKDQYTAEALKAVCARYVRCGVMQSVASCIATYQSLAGSLGSGFYDEAIAAGQVKYDGALARRCLEDFAAAECSSPPTLGADCVFIYQGQVEAGGECVIAECVPSAYCSRENGACPGTCTTRVPEGGAATSAGACAASLTLLDGKCSKPRQAGESCRGGSECDPARLVCGSDAVCKAPAVLGQPCSPSTPCGVLYSCVDGTCQGYAGLGQSCASLSCMLDLYCDNGSAPATCKEPLGEGQACGYASPCKPPLRCSAASGTCAAPVGLGQSCATASCDSTGFCDQATKLCKAPIPVGQPCNLGDSCASLAYCTDGTCKSFFGCP